ncbi:14878_t:CDS:1, partial [Acaulospora colombiana]
TGDRRDQHQRNKGFFKSVFEPRRNEETRYNRLDHYAKEKTQPNSDEKQDFREEKNPKGSIGDFFNNSVSKLTNEFTGSQGDRGMPGSTGNTEMQVQIVETEVTERETTRNFAARLRLSKVTARRQGDHQDEITSNEMDETEYRPKSRFGHDSDQTGGSREKYRHDDVRGDYQRDDHGRRYAFPHRDGHYERRSYEPRDRNFGKRDDQMGTRGRRMLENITRDLNRMERERETLGDRDILTWGKYPSKKQEMDQRRDNPLTKKNLYKHPWPNLYKRLHGVQDKTIMHFENLRKSKQYRWEQKKIMVQGEAKILDLIKKGFQVKSLVVTAPYKPKTRYEIQPPALDYLEKPPSIMAENYYLMSIDMVRKILGSAARPEKHELVAEFPFPTVEFPSEAELDRLLILENVNDASDLGMLIRSAKALGWKGIYLINKSGDVYNDFVQRTSDFHSLTLPYIYGTLEELQEFLATNEMMIIYAKKPTTEISSGPQFIRKSDMIITSEQTDQDDVVETRLKFWYSREKDQEIRFPSRFALFLSDAYTPTSLPEVLKVGVDASNMSIPSTGSLLMWELNRIMENFNDSPKQN